VEIPIVDNVWTNASVDGGLDPTNLNCGNWTSTSGRGNVGQKNNTNSTWTVEGEEPCDGPAEITRLYCFQQ
jgi:hypothetical protein